MITIKEGHKFVKFHVIWITFEGFNKDSIFWLLFESFWDIIEDNDLFGISVDIFKILFMNKKNGSYQEKNENDMHFSFYFPYWKLWGILMKNICTLILCPPSMHIDSDPRAKLNLWPV